MHIHTHIHMYAHIHTRMRAHMNAHMCRAMDGDEAMEWLSSQETLPDLVLLDCMMPNMSGHEFCAELRQVRCLVLLLCREKGHC